MKISYEVRNCLLPALTVLVSAVTLAAQDFSPTPASLLVVNNPKQLARMAIARPAPEYPPIAKLNYVEGLVQIAITVSNSGHVMEAHVLTGNPLLAAASLKAVTNWLYRPLGSPDGPRGFSATVQLQFTTRHPSVQISSKQAERDFNRQIKPPLAVSTTSDTPAEKTVRMRLLVNDEGRVVDEDPSKIERTLFEAACKKLQTWTFRPAYWGTLPVPAYLNVDVPIGAAAITRAAAMPVLQ